MSSENGEDWEVVKLRTIEAARKMYPMAADDVDALARWVTNISHHTRERNEYMAKFYDADAALRRMRDDRGAMA